MKSIGISTVLLLVFNFTWAQESISPQGNHDVMNDVQVSWTLGQLVSENFEVDGLLVSEGIHHLPITAIPLNSVSSISDVLIYPNPTVKGLVVKSPKKGIQYSLITTSGQIIESGTIVDNYKSIDLADLEIGTYILNLTLENSSNSYKIIKSN